MTIKKDIDQKKKKTISVQQHTLFVGFKYLFGICFMVILKPTQMYKLLQVKRIIDSKCFFFYTYISLLYILRLLFSLSSALYTLLYHISVYLSV